MFKKSDKLSSTRIAIDLGGFHTRILNDSDGLLVDEPTVGLQDMAHRSGGTAAVSIYGDDAVQAESDSSSTRLLQILQSDCRNPLGYSANMLRYHFSRLRRSGNIGKAPIVLLNIPPGIPQSLTEELKHACFTAGASRVHLVDNAISNAVGVGLEIDESAPQLLLDLGARAARLYAIQFNDIVSAYALPFGGDALDGALVDGIRARYGIHVSASQAQYAKHRVGCAMTSSLGHQMPASCQMRGMQILENQTANFTLTTEVACELLQPAMTRAAEALGAAVQALPYQFRDPQQDIPIVITGGGSQLPQLDQLVMEASGRPVEIAADPINAAVKGGAKLLARIHGALTPA